MPSRAYRRGRALSRASFSVIAAVFLLLSTSLAMGVAGQLHQRSITALLDVPKPQYLVLIVLDGAEPSYLHVAPLPHLDALRTQGIEYDRAWAGILESETPAGHATISTGSSPARDGLLGFNWVNDGNDLVHLFDPDVIRQGTMEHLMQVSGAPTIAGLVKKRYPAARVVALSGHKYYAADAIGGPSADAIMYYTGTPDGKFAPTAIPGHVPPAGILTQSSLTAPHTSLPMGAEDHLAMRLAIRTFSVMKPKVTLINVPEFDWPLGHIDGGDRDPAGVKALMQGFDADLGKLEAAYRKAGVLDKTLFVITADHGMAPLQYQIPDQVLDDAVTKAGATSLETTYSTGGFIWLKDASQAGAVAANIVQTKNPHVQSVYYLQSDKAGTRYVPAGGPAVPASVDAANRYLLQSFLGGNAPDVVTFCREGAAFVTRGGETWKANHGGAAWNSQHVPLVISGPGAAMGVVSHSPARLEDVAPTALTLLGVKPTSMQGSPLADALRAPTTQQRIAQNAINSKLTPLVNALSTESGKELASR